MSMEEKNIRTILEKISSIRTVTYKGNVSPHKFIFLLMIAKFYEIDPLRENRFYLDNFLEEKYLNLWIEKYPTVDHEKIFIEYPFYHLSNDKLWNLKIKDLKINDFHELRKTQKPRFTKKRLEEIVEYGYLDIELDYFLRRNNSRDKIIELLEKNILNMPYGDYDNNKEVGNQEKKENNNLETNFKGNPFVNYLNLLHNRDANSQNLAESLATNPFSGMLQIPHPLSEQIRQLFQNRDKKNIILTGHAGDGKTTIAIEILKRIKNINLEEPLKEILNPKEILRFDNKEIVIIKDLSEWSEKKRVDVVNEMINNHDKHFLIISNSGTLMDTFCAYEKEFGDKNITKIENDILSRLNSNSSPTWHFRNNDFYIINLALYDNLAIAKKIFCRMLDPKNWEICQNRECQKICPIFRNLKLFWDNENIAIERIFLVYKKMYEYGKRFTLRQLTAHLSYMITSGLQYQDIQKYLKDCSEFPMTKYMFFNRFFGDDGEKIDRLALQMELIKEIRIEELGIKACPVWERKIWTNNENERFSPNINGFEEYFSKLYNESLKPDSKNSHKYRGQIRRILYFLYNFPSEDKDNNYLKTFLNSPMILKLLSWQNKNSNDLDFQDRQFLKRNIFHVLQEYFAGIRLPEGISTSERLYITLNRGSDEIRQSTQVILANFLRDRFEIKLEEEKDGIGNSRKNLIFKYKEGNQKIIFDLPMLDYVVMRGVGLISQVLEKSYIDRLENFKGQLLLNQNMAEDTVEIVTLQTNYRFKRQKFILKDNKLEVHYG